MRLNNTNGVDHLAFFNHTRLRSHQNNVYGRELFSFSSEITFVDDDGSEGKVP